MLNDNYKIPESGKYNPPIAHYSEVECSLDPDNVKKLIGRNGYYFNIITKSSKVNYIWYDNKRHVVEIWGPMDCLADAKNRIIKRMSMILSKSQLHANE
jgi:hypothetical protein